MFGWNSNHFCRSLQGKMLEKSAIFCLFPFEAHRSIYLFSHLTYNCSEIIRSYVHTVEGSISSCVCGSNSFRFVILINQSDIFFAMFNDTKLHILYDGAGENDFRSGAKILLYFFCLVRCTKMRFNRIQFKLERKNTGSKIVQ